MTRSNDTPPRRRVLIIGLGFIGRALAVGLRKRDVDDVAALTRTAPSPPLDGVSVVVGDSRDEHVVRSALADVDHVVFTAGGLLPAHSNVDPIRDVSLALPPLLTMLEALREHPGVGFTFLSSGGTVYGNPSVTPVPEGEPLMPITSYGIMKVAAEHYVRMYGELYGIPSVVLRCANVYGPGQVPDRGQGVVATLLACVARGETVKIFGDGSSVRDYVYIDDVIDVIQDTISMASAASPVLNVGSGVGSTLNDVVRAAEHATGRRPILEHLPARGQDVRSIVLDVRALHRVHKRSFVDLEHGMERTWHALRESIAVEA